MTDHNGREAPGTTFERILEELEAAATGVQVIIGEMLGLYKALAADDGLTAADLAERTGTSKRYAAKWLEHQVRVGHVEYDADQRRYYMQPEKAALLVGEESPAYMASGECGLDSLFDCEPSFTEVLQTFLYIHRDLSNGENGYHANPRNHRLYALLK